MARQATPLNSICLPKVHTSQFSDADDVSSICYSKTRNTLYQANEA
jgi:hypothetical protein